MGVGGLPGVLERLDEEIAIAEKNPEKFCPMYTMSKTYVRESLSKNGITREMAKKFAKCYNCEGEDKNCPTYINFINGPLLS